MSIVREAPEHTGSSIVEYAITAERLTKTYRRGSEEVHALSDVTFNITKGEFAAVVGPSGAGKTTLLQLIGAMDTPTSGKLNIAGHEVAHMSDGELTRLRRVHIGFVFQHFSLLPTLTVAENVALPAVFSRNEVRSRVEWLLEKVGLTHRKNHRPSELSGGEMQRAAIARALINSPDLLLADEPTGNLDSATSERVIGLLGRLHLEGLTVVVVTHNDLLAGTAERRIHIADGRIAGEDCDARKPEDR